MIKVQDQDFDVAQLYQALRQNNQTGAVAMFVGLVRDFTELGDSSSKLSSKTNNQAKSQKLIQSVFELEHYPGMTEYNLEKIVMEAKSRWELQDVILVHRVGKLKIQDQIVFVGVASSHRANAFSACDFIMDYLKSRAAFWKKETQGNTSKWVEAKDSDEHSLGRWQS